MPVGGLSAAAAALAIAGCAPENDGAASRPNTVSGAGCIEGGYVTTTLYGAVDVELDWDSDLACEGMPRPAGAGGRLRFAGLAGENHPIAIIIALPSLERDVAAGELASNVTVIEEGTGRFFSTAGLDDCWTDVGRQEPVPGRPGVSSVAGTLYCISPLGEVNGAATISIPELRFSGVLDWNAS